MAVHRQDPSTTTAGRRGGHGKAALQSAFEKRVLRGLSAEWENALWLLPDGLRQSISRPLFAIRDMHGRLGTWAPAKGEITLSREIINDHSWDDIREVLLHEMAHQVAHEGLKATAESDHGKCFRQACDWLSANPKASGSSPPLHTRLRQGEAVDEKDRMVVRIHKLMALAESSNANEAHAAMRKAHQLISRHNVDLIRRGTDQAYFSIFLGVPRLRHFREVYHLAHLLQDFYFVQGMWIQAWVLEKGKMGRVLEISGSRKNVLIAAYIHDSVHRYIDRAWKTYGHGKHLNRYRKTDFAVGVIEGFRTTLQKASEAGALENGASLPVRIEDRALTRYMTHRYPHVRSSSRSGAGYDLQVMADGRQIGKSLIIAKGITSRDGYKDQMLEYHGKGSP